MKLSYLLFGLVLSVLGTVAVHGETSEARLNLLDDWQLKSSAEVGEPAETVSSTEFRPEDWRSTSIPMTVLAALVADKTYPDPFVGDNITRIPGYRDDLWLAMGKDSPFWPSWWYRKVFTLPAQLQGQNLVLHLDGINYRANVWLNGKRIADNESVVGMFRRFEFDINDYVRFDQENCLALEITAPGHIEDKNYKTKQIEATTGWDDHNPQPPDLNMGIWRDVYITGTGPVAIRYPYVSTDLDLPSLEVAHLTVSASLVNKTSQPVEGQLIGTIESLTFSQQVSLNPGETRIIVFTPTEFPQLTIAKPRLWWPNGTGSPELYDLDLQFQSGEKTSDSDRTRFGIRELTTYINEEGWRAYRVNGKNILVRGGAWMNSDMLLRFSPKRYEALVRYAKEAGFNMLRSEGFTIRETDEFYDLCDQYGVMVTQQLFGRSIPDEKLAIACVEDTLLRIRNHPSLAHFLGHDETFPTETLDKAYRDLIAKHTPERTYQPHSGAFELEERFETGGTRTGSLQVWTYAPPNHYYIAKETSAWGFAQSGGIGGVFASAESMRKFLPEQALWPPWTEEWSLHTVMQGGKYFNAVLLAMNDRYGEPANIEEFCRKGFALNYECARGMFEAYGRNKYSATGITTWKFNAAWPASPTWQYIDWYLSPTGAYYGAKKACESVHVQYSYDDQSICVVNGTYQDKPGLKVTARLLNLDLSERFSNATTVNVPADGVVKAFTIEQPDDISKTYFLILKLEETDGKVISENFYWLSSVPDIPSKFELFFEKPLSTADYKALNSLPEATLNVAAKTEKPGFIQVKVQNPSQSLAFFVRFSLKQGEKGPEVSPVYWSDNCISMLPGEERVLFVAFSEDDLLNSEPVISIDGWNMAPYSINIEHE